MQDSLRVSSIDPEETIAWEQVEPRRIERGDWLRYEGYMREIFGAMGMDLDSDATKRSPERFLKALYDSTAGYEGDPKLMTAFPTECRCDADCMLAQIIEGPISFYALCEHHSLPFHGFAHIAYIAHERILGLSKLSRLVRLFARRFTVQERLAEEIADGLRELAGARGVAVRLEAAHMCTAMRGVEEDGSLTVTTVWRGLYDEDVSLRSEFLTLTR